MNLELRSKLLRAKSLLNKLSDTSYAYSNISKDYPFTNVSTDKEAEKLLAVYQQLIDDVVSSAKNYEQGKKNQK